jgi:hypothetical protein
MPTGSLFRIVPSTFRWVFSSETSQNQTTEGLLPGLSSGKSFLIQSSTGRAVSPYAAPLVFAVRVSGCHWTWIR